MNQIQPTTKLERTGSEKKKQTIIRFGNSSKIEPAAKVRAMVAGVFTISFCAAVMAFQDGNRPEVSWIFTLSLLWCCAVRLWMWKLPRVGLGAKWLFPFIKGLWKVFSWTFVLWMVSYLISRQKETHEKAVIIANYGIPAYLFCQYLVWLALDSLKEKD